MTSGAPPLLSPQRIFDPSSPSYLLQLAVAPAQDDLSQTLERVTFKYEEPPSNRRFGPEDFAFFDDEYHFTTLHIEKLIKQSQEKCQRRKRHLFV